MKNLLCAIIYATLVSALYAQSGLQDRQDAAAIVTASRDRIKAAAVSTRSRMMIQGKDGSTSERLIDQYTKDGPKGKRTLIVFQQPKTVAGTRFLTMENPGNEDDRWIFLPSLGKVRRIAGSEGSGSFMGTDFSYDDIASASRSAALDRHTILREESLAGRNCYVIESVPLNNSYQYSKMIQWIDKENSAEIKLELYDRRGTLVKIAEMSGFKNVQGYLTAMTTKITTVSKGTSTTINVDIIKYNDPIPESVFTTAYLETGRAK